ncbi:class I ribonucleotide reductase maintenance protein YfaE [Serratia sp. DD3]|uniref:class I ribonucleotide reductase maintenance protein YfaE n=1 Tax=Serratia sp. DD3 TaxID=1410619 RepID=UPI0003C512D9|nr:class I ribonucleotide reductase maintenance protein YfaE [Serratia sp. DD3]KEY60392.1 CDP-6-deoxy-L-threo-D-glycero-4-hexulose-3-dehydrase reductase [Serratia sp. DD3]
MSSPTITLRASGAQLSAAAGESCLLEILELHDVAVEYQCRSGYCGACRLKLLKGKVAYRQAPLAFVNDGEILPCCCMPLMDIELEI